jgi:hypothetical protein
MATPLDAHKAKEKERKFYSIIIVLPFVDTTRSSLKHIFCVAEHSIRALLSYS